MQRTLKYFEQLSQEPSQTHIVRSIRVVIRPTKERSSRVSSDVCLKNLPATRVIVKEPFHVMYETSHEDERPHSRLLLVCNADELAAAWVCDEQVQILS